VPRSASSKAADFLADGAGERSALVAEKLGFEKTGSECAAQLILTKVRSRRGLRVWMARAKSSLPVPVSPRRRTAVPAGSGELHLGQGALERGGSRRQFPQN